METIKFHEFFFHWKLLLANLIHTELKMKKKNKQKNMSISLLITIIIANTRLRYDEQIELISEFVY